jgi:DNA-binding protein HU-beta
LAIFGFTNRIEGVLIPASRVVRPLFALRRAFQGAVRPMETSMSAKLNKSDLIKAVAEAAELKQTEATRVVEATFDTITRELRKGNQIAIAGFGTFAAKHRAAREGRNPATKQAITIPARTAAVFKPAAVLKDL